MKLKDLAGQSVLSGLSVYSTLDGRTSIRIRLCQTVYEFVESPEFLGCLDPIITEKDIDVAFFPVPVIISLWEGILSIRNAETDSHIMSVGTKGYFTDPYEPYFTCSFSPWALVQLGHSQ